MHMIPGYMPLQDFHFIGLADLDHLLAEPQANLASQHRLPILGDPDKVVLQVKPRVGRCPVVLHLPSLTEVFA